MSGVQLRLKLILVITTSMIVIGGAFGSIWILTTVRKNQALSNAGDFTVDLEILQLSPTLNSFLTSEAADWLTEVHGEVLVTSMVLEAMPHSFEAAYAQLVTVEFQVLFADGTQGTVYTRGSKEAGYQLAYRVRESVNGPEEDIQLGLLEFEAQGITWFMEQGLTHFNLSSIFAKMYGVTVTVRASTLNGAIWGFLTFRFNPNSFSSLGQYEVTYLSNGTIYTTWANGTGTVYGG